MYEQFLPGGSINRPHGLVSVGLGTRIVRRSSGTVEGSETVRNPSDRHTQTPQKPERTDESCTQTHRNQTTRPVDRSGYCLQNKSRTQGKFIVLSIYLLDICKMYELPVLSGQRRKSKNVFYDSGEVYKRQQ